MEEVPGLQRYSFSAYVIGITSLQYQESALLYTPAYKSSQDHLGLVSEHCWNTIVAWASVSNGSLNAPKHQLSFTLIV